MVDIEVSVEIGFEGLGVVQLPSQRVTELLVKWRGGDQEALHALLPPHPGPLIAVSALHADLGLTLGLGLIVAIPAVILAGPLYGIWLSKRMHVVEPEEMGKLFSAKEDTGEKLHQCGAEDEGRGSAAA